MINTLASGWFSSSRYFPARIFGPLMGAPKSGAKTQKSNNPASSGNQAGHDQDNAGHTNVDDQQAHGDENDAGNDAGNPTGGGNHKFCQVVHFRHIVKKIIIKINAMHAGDM